MKKLILTEKPQVARDFAKALDIIPKGHGLFENHLYVITWSIGHLYAPFEPADYDLKWKKWSIDSLPIVPEKILYRPITQTKKQLNIVISQLKRKDISEIIVATDAGREGELIARIILHFAKSKKTCKRFWTSQSLTKSTILEELKKNRPLELYDRLYKAGKARQMADWLVGMNLSRLATLKLGDLFSIGRVQTAVLSILVRRRKEIDHFISKDFFQLRGKFNFKKGEIEALWFDPNKKKETFRIDKKETANKLVQLLASKQTVVVDHKRQERSIAPPQLYSLTELQRAANIRYNFSAKKTLDLAQKLYETYKCISYPRTDSRVLGSKSFLQTKDLLSKFNKLQPKYFGDIDPKKISMQNRLVFNDAKLTDHHALMPLKAFKGNAANDEGKIFDLILRRFIVVFSKDFRYIDTTIVLKVEDHFFKALGKNIIEMGWKNLEGKENEKTLIDISKDETGTCQEIKIEEKKTLPPSEYTDSSLLKEMINPQKMVEDKEHKQIFRGEIGLGTQATRAQIIETLINRKYVARKSKNLIAVEKGVTLIGVLKDFEISKTLISPSQTANWEIELEKISKGEIGDQRFIGQIKKFVKESTSEWKNKQFGHLKTRTRSTFPDNKSKNSLGKCPLCQGNVIDKSKAYGCDLWNSGCKFTVWKKIAGKTITKTQIKKLIKTGRTDIIKGFKSKNDTTFNARLKLQKTGKTEFKFD